MQSFLPYIPTVLQLLLFLIMLGMGMTLTVKDFFNVGTNPKALLIGLTNQIILVPLIAFGLINLLPLDPYLAMGLMVVSCCPGGAVSNLFSYLAKGDTALSISLTALSSIITVFTIPLILVFAMSFVLGAEASIQLPLGKTIFYIFKLSALPVILGMMIHHYLPKFSERCKPAIGWFSGLVIVLALALMVVKLEEIGDSWMLLKASFVSVLLLNIFTLGIGFASSRALGLSTKQSATVSIESGMQNNVLGMTLAISPTFLGEPRMAATAGVYGVVMCTLAILVVWLFKRLILSKEVIRLRP